MTKTRIKTELAAAIILVIVGCFLLIAAIYIPPIGIIHPSVLVAFGEIAVFAGSLFGIDLHYRLEFNKIKAEVGACLPLCGGQAFLYVLGTRPFKERISNYK